MKPFTISPNLLTVFLITMLITGCAAFNTDLRIIDKIPDNMPKGYVEFYTVENEDAIEIDKEFPGGFFIYKLEDGVEKEIEEMVWSWRTKRRIAVKPGRHIFRIKFASADEKVTVDVADGMIIPVRVLFKRLGELIVGYRTKTQNFSMDVKVEPAIPNKITANQ